MSIEQIWRQQSGGKEEGSQRWDFPGICLGLRKHQVSILKKGKLMDSLRQRLPSPHIGPWHHHWATYVFGLVHKVFKKILMSYNMKNSGDTTFIF